MKIQFLGTGAADWDEDVTGSSPDVRRFSSALVDGSLLIDAGPSVFQSAEAHDIDLDGVSVIIQTHSHRDHFCGDTVRRFTDRGVKLIKMDPGDVKNVGKYMISAVKANHGTCGDAVHYLIDDGRSRMFYGLDGAWLLYDEISLIKEKHVDLMVLDGTIGDIKGDYRIFEHNNLRMVEIMKDSLREYADRFIISHLAKSLHDKHDLVAERMKRSGIEVAYDGMCIEI